MERNDLNKSICEELFGGKLEVAAESDYSQRSNARQQKDCLYGTFQMQMKLTSRVEEIVQNIHEFCKIKRNMFLTIREGIAVV